MKISIKRYTLRGDTNKLEEFNSGKYARTNYKWLYKLEMMRKDDTLFLLATPSFSLVLHSIRALWNAKDGDPFDRRDHPAILQAFFGDPRVDEMLESAQTELQEAEIAPETPDPGQENDHFYRDEQPKRKSKKARNASKKAQKTAA